MPPWPFSSGILWVLWKRRRSRVTLHRELTREILQGPSGPKVGAFFDLDQTLLAGFSAIAFCRERLVTGRMAPRELGEGLLGALSFSLGRIGFSGFLAATTAAYRGLSERVLEEVGQDLEVTRERIRQIEAKALRKLRHPSRSKRLKAFVD